MCVCLSTEKEGNLKSKSILCKDHLNKSIYGKSSLSRVEKEKSKYCRKPQRGCKHSKLIWIHSEGDNYTHTWARVKLSRLSNAFLKSGYLIITPVFQVLLHHSALLCSSYHVFIFSPVFNSYLGRNKNKKIYQLSGWSFYRAGTKRRHGQLNVLFILF